MAVTVGEIMNGEVYTARPTELAGPVLKHLLTLGIGGGPVVDDRGRPLGVIAVRDLALVNAETPIEAFMTSPALVIRKSESISAAAFLMAETGYHRLVVVDGDRVAGLVSSLDVLRGLIGLPAQHPASFPHYDARTGTSWTDETLLDYEHVEVAPAGPGVFIVIEGGAGRPERVIWGESSDNVRERLLEYLRVPKARPTLFAYWQQRGVLRFRAAKVEDPRARRQALDRALLEART